MSSDEKTHWWQGVGEWDHTTNDLFPVLELSGWEKLPELLRGQHFCGDQRSWVFRGQSNSSWSLTSSLERRFRNGIVPSDVQSSHLKFFKQAIRGRLPGFQNFHDNEVWAVGQHEGLATPLLDWTTSPFVALFFAINEYYPNEQRRAVYAINKTKLEAVTEGLFFEPSEGSNPRLLGQSGLFTISPADTETLETTILKRLEGDDLLSEESDEARALSFADYGLKIVFPDARRSDGMLHLEQMNIHWASLFPDLDGASRYCNSILPEQKILQPIQVDTPFPSVALPSLTPKVRQPFGPASVNLPSYPDQVNADHLKSWLSEKRPDAEENVVSRAVAGLLKQINGAASETWLEFPNAGSAITVRLKREFSSAGFGLDVSQALARELVDHFRGSAKRRHEDLWMRSELDD